MGRTAKELPTEPNVPRLLHAHKLCKTHPNLAIQEYEALAELGSRTAMVHLGVGFERGNYWPASLGDAESWLRRAADCGSELGQYYLGRFYLSQKRYDEALSTFRLSAAREYGPALHFVGRMYYFGTGVARDTGKAKSYLQRASDNGNLTARLLLSRLLQRDEPGLLNRIKGTMLKWNTLVEALIVILTEGQSSERFK